MSLVCPTAVCGALPLPSPLTACLTPKESTGDCFALVKCDVVFTDITDPAEWTTKITGGDVIATPQGFWGSALPAQTSFSIGCGLTHTTQVGKQFVFESFLVDESGLTDQDFYKTLRENIAGYRIIPITCNQEFYLSQPYIDADTAIAQNPGHIFSYIVPPDFEIVSGENNLFKWTFTIEIPTQGILCSRYLPGVYDVLKG